MERSTSTGSIARTYALVFGIAYVVVAVVEDVLGSSGLSVGGATILKVTPVQNAIHWLVGVAVLGSFFAGETAARLVARIVGVVFVVVTLLGVFARHLTGELLGFHGNLPWSYNVVHALTAVAALIAGFAVSKIYGTADASPIRAA
jgi:hypothetical protein